MAKCKVTRPIKLANGLTVPEGEICVVVVEERRPTVAKIWSPSAGDFCVQCRNLYHYFDDFFKITMADLEEAVFDGICPSIYTGADVEPDGWDEHGFPSILLAVGMV